MSAVNLTTSSSSASFRGQLLAGTSEGSVIGDVVLIEDGLILVRAVKETLLILGREEVEAMLLVVSVVVCSSAGVGIAGSRMGLDASVIAAAAGGAVIVDDWISLTGDIAIRGLRSSRWSTLVPLTRREDEALNVGLPL